ncbi:uncharacterized protein LOC112043176 [Bicyclus anynana]|uniref:Uncharacterized protein LOC112043176 n=1 Tax=Bicyclus anynana TaxID=110368 RepID=A0A6J1MIS2_BICAN|nr:uncharacterized protein LOC112043176 [Bicyclus anynana]
MVHFVTTLILSALSVIHANVYRHCLLFKGKCVIACPRTMHPYHTRCNGDTMSQATCDSPIPRILGYTCGWSRCDCNGDMLWDDQNEYCVKSTECPLYISKPSKRKSRRSERRKQGKRRRKSKNIEIKEEPEPFD